MTSSQDIEPADSPTMTVADCDLERKLERLSELMKRMVRSVRLPDDHEDLTPTQMVVLSHLEQQPMRIGVLANAVGAAQNTISEVVARLERCTLVTKSRDRSDQRAVVVGLSELGRKALEQRRATMLQAHRQLLEALSLEDRHRFIEAFELLVGMVERARAQMSQAKHETRRKR